MLRLKAIGRGLYGKMKDIALDYKAAAEGTLQYSKERPVRAFLYTSAVVCGFLTYRKIPTEASYTASLVESSNEVLLLCEEERNKETDNYLQNNLQYLSMGRLRYQSMGLFAVVYYSDHDKDTKTYISQCKYSNPRWNELPKYVIDIGFLGVWWKLQYRMTDYDVDFNDLPKEFKHSYEQLFDFVKQVFGYTYYNITAQPVKIKIPYVETNVDKEPTS